MCGIAGLMRLGERTLRPDDPARLTEMADTIAHRGPDARGEIGVDACALANLRLSILDLSPAGNQPMTSQDGRYTLVYNGEIYNYVEVRSALADIGLRFHGGSDSEVLLRAFEAWGERCVERLVGMWAFAIYDAHERRLHLSRDRFGIKPLYYLQAPGVLAFASEIKALVAFMRAEGLPVRPNPSSVATYVGTGLVDGLEDTFFEGVRRFPAAANGVVDAGGLTVRPYWSLPEAAAARAAEVAGRDDATIAAILRRQLDDAIRIHLRSDVPLGVCLSGGLDSSTVVGLASRHVPRVRTFTVTFEDTGFDERPHAEQVVAAFGAQASFRQARAADLLETLPRILWHLDEPALAPAVFPQWLVMELASEQVKVVLDGQGGDEVFGGYLPYYTQYLYQLAGGLDAPTFAREAMSLASMVSPAFARSAARDALAMTLRRPRRAAPIAAPDAVMLAPELRPRVDATFNEWRLWPRVFADDWLNNVLYWELTRFRLPALLRYEDRLSMAFSIESRVPLLDHRVVELGFALPARWKIRDGWSKWGLRRAMDGLLPPTITWRRDKKGFPTPLGAWLRNGLGREVEDLLCVSGRRALPYLDPAAVRQTLAAHAASGGEVGATGRPARIWRALNLEIWMERFGL